jgi:hypothetical protein
MWATALARSGAVKLKGFHELISQCDVALEQSSVTPPEITVHVEPSRFADVVSQAPQEDTMRMHGYVVVATELAQKSELASRQR